MSFDVLGKSRPIAFTSPDQSPREFRRRSEYRRV